MDAVISEEEVKFTCHMLGVSLVGLGASYLCGCRYLNVPPREVYGESKSTARVRGWILTLLSSATTTTVSLRFVADLVSAHFNVMSVPTRPELSFAVTSFFMAYLLLDLGLGMTCYPGQMNSLTGYFHHVAYLGLLAVVSYRRLCHVFALALFMELPTMMLATNYVFPSTRHDRAFATVFFINRIVFHLFLLVLFLYHIPQLGVFPSLSLLSALPMHLLWFMGSVRGILRREREKRVAEPRDIKERLGDGSDILIVSPDSSPTLGPDMSLPGRLLFRRKSSTMRL